MTLPVFAEHYTIPKTMRAAVLCGPQDIRLLDRPVPQSGPGEVLVQVAMCGTCGTDLKIYDGHFPLTLPFGAFTPGHEWTGTVVALGETADECAVGDRVCIEAHHGCGRCDNVKRAVSLAAQGRMRGSNLVTHEFPLENIAEAFRVMRERIDDPIKIVIIP